MAICERQLRHKVLTTEGNSEEHRGKWRIRFQFRSVGRGRIIRRADPAWAPLGEPIFRSLWIAAVISYTGTWMQNVGAGWLMTQLTTSPLMVSLVQAAAAVPVFLVVLPAGALADMVDRRRLLLFTQGWMVVAVRRARRADAAACGRSLGAADLHVSAGAGRGDE